MIPTKRDLQLTLEKEGRIRDEGGIYRGYMVERPRGSGIDNIDRVRAIVFHHDPRAVYFEFAFLAVLINLEFEATFDFHFYDIG